MLFLQSKQFCIRQRLNKSVFKLNEMKNHIKIFLAAFIAVLVLTMELFAAGTPAGTMIQTRSRVTFSTRSGVSIDTVYSEYTNIVVSQKASFNITPISNAQTTQSDSVIVAYAVSVINSGNGTDAARLSVISSQGWFTEIYQDISGDKILQPNEKSLGTIKITPAIAADEQNSLIIFVYVPRGEALNGIQDSATFEVKSDFDSTISNSGMYITTVHTSGLDPFNPGLVVNNPTPRAGQSVIYSFTLTNNGLATANNVSISNVIPAGLSFVSGSTTIGTFSGTGVQRTWTVSTLSPGQSVTITLTLAVGTAVTAGTIINNHCDISYSVSSKSYTLSTNVVPLTVSGALAYGVQISSLFPSLTKEAADTAWYRFSIRNSGSFKDLIELSYSSTRGLAWKLYRDGNNNSVWDLADPLLTNTNDSAGVDIDSVAIGDSVRVFAMASMPRFDVDLQKDSLQIIALSSGDHSKFDSKWSVTTVTVPMVSIAKSIFPVGSQPAGSIVTYTISYVNSGSAAVNNFSVSDVSPGDTRYLFNSVKVNGVAVSDNSGGVSVSTDQSNNTIISVSIGALTAGSNGSVEFKVKIK